MLKFLPYAGFRTGEVIYVVLDSYMQGLQAALLLKGSQKKKKPPWTKNIYECKVRLREGS